MEVKKILKELGKTDLYTCFFVLNYLHDYDSEIFNGKVIAKILKILTASETEEGGPYHSFVKRKFQKGPDYMVNLEIQSFLKRLNVELPKLDEFLREKQKNNCMFSEFNSCDVLKRNLVKTVLKNFPQDMIVENKESDENGACDEVAQNFKKIVIHDLRMLFKRFDSDFEELILEIFNKIRSFDKKDEIILLPYYFRKSLKNDFSEKISDNTIISLCVANQLIWMSYTIYDDFLDDEGDIRFLSIANFCLRNYVKIFSGVIKDSEFSFIFDDIMNKLDSANAWEIKNCRTLVSNDVFYVPEKLPDYGDFSKLAERSLAHALGPLLILFIALGEKNTEHENLYLFFKHYLIARQLNDDQHDWEEDLENGHLDAVVTEILKKANLKTINIKKDIPLLQQDFWLSLAPEISQVVLDNIVLAKKYLSKISVIETGVYLEQFLFSTENAAKIAIKEQKEILDVLEAYR